MSEFDPSRRKFLLGATIAGCAIAANGISSLAIWAGRVGEDVAKDLRIIEEQGNPPITVPKDEFFNVLDIRKNSAQGSEEWKKANDIIGNELKAQVKLKEEQYIQRARINSGLFGFGGVLTAVGVLLLKPLVRYEKVKGIKIPQIDLTRG